MKAVFLGGLVLVLASGLAACTTKRGDAGGEAGTEVTRVHLGQPVARG